MQIRVGTWFGGDFEERYENIIDHLLEVGQDFVQFEDITVEEDIQLVSNLL